MRGEIMGYEQLPPEVPMWSQDRACKNCEALNERIKVLEDALFSKGAMFDAPCFCCGYNGHNYFDPRIHGCALRHHALAKS
jgi:hypothetical protein